MYFHVFGTGTEWGAGQDVRELDFGVARHFRVPARSLSSARAWSASCRRNSARQLDRASAVRPRIFWAAVAPVQTPFVDNEPSRLRVAGPKLHSTDELRMFSACGTAEGGISRPRPVRVLPRHAQQEQHYLSRMQQTRHLRGCERGADAHEG